MLSDYVQGRVKKAGVRNQVRFRHPVKWVEYLEAEKKFLVTAQSLEADQRVTEKFDYVVFYTGHYSFSNFPQLPGFESFNGRILHAHDFRDAVEFKDKDILLIGTSYSAEDIGSQCYKYGAKSITVSFRNRQMGFSWPSNWKEVSLLTHVEGKCAYFKDGTHKDVDAIILCTGYCHHFPFLPDKTDNRLWPLGLYKGIFWEANHRLMYIGMQDQYYTFNMFEAQAWYTRDVILGRIKLPSLSEMKVNSLIWWEREMAWTNPHDQIVFQGDYVKELLAVTDYPHLDVNEAFIEWKHHKQEDIMGFRDRAFVSVVTGNQSPVHHTP